MDNLTLCYREHNDEPLSDIRVWVDKNSRFGILTLEEFTQLEFFCTKLAPRFGVNISLEYFPKLNKVKQT